MVGSCPHPLALLFSLPGPPTIAAPALSAPGGLSMPSPTPALSARHPVRSLSLSPFATPLARGAPPHGPPPHSSAPT